MGERQDRLPAAAAAALHHIEQAHRELARCVTEGPFERPETLPSENLLAAYLCLKREHEALRAQYEADMRRWLAFKQWWKERLREKRRRRSARQAASPSRKTPVKLSPRKVREQILQHRQQVRERMEDNPALFKGLGRYRVTSKYAIDADPGLFQNRHQQLLYPPKKSTHAIYYAVVGRHAAEASGSRSTKRHKTIDPTPPDYWYVLWLTPRSIGFPSTQEEASLLSESSTEERLSPPTRVM